MASELSDLPGTSFEPERHLAGQIAANVTVRPLAIGNGIILGQKRSYSVGGNTSVPREVVFVWIDSGNPSRPIKGGPDERNIVGRIVVRSAPAGSQEAYRRGLLLARDVHDAVDQRPPAGYCECRAVNSHPIALGQDAESHWEWEISVEMTVDVTVL